MPHNCYFLWDTHVVYTSGWSGKHLLFCITLNFYKQRVICSHFPSSLDSIWGCCQKWAEESVVRGTVEMWAGIRGSVDQGWGMKSEEAGELNQVSILGVLGFPGDSAGKESTCNAGDLGSIPGSGRSPGEGNGNPLQYSCLENPKDGGAWQVTVHRVTKSQTQLSDQAHYSTGCTGGKECCRKCGARWKCCRDNKTTWRETEGILSCRAHWSGLHSGNSTSKGYIAICCVISL